MLGDSFPPSLGPLLTLPPPPWCLSSVRALSLPWLREAGQEVGRQCSVVIFHAWQGPCEALSPMDTHYTATPPLSFLSSHAVQPSIPRPSQLSSALICSLHSNALLLLFSLLLSLFLLPLHVQGCFACIYVWISHVCNARRSRRQCQVP